MADASFDDPPSPFVDAGRSTRRKIQSERVRWHERDERLKLCTFFQKGCCWFDVDCYFRHAPASEASSHKMMMCEKYALSGHCSVEDCPFAHGEEELRTPKEFEGQRGFKNSLCTWHLLDNMQCEEESQNCWDAHGKLDLRRPLFRLPPDLHGVDFTFCDAHLHLDHVLLARTYGSNWMWKRSLCTHDPCRRPNCAWAHGTADLLPRLPLSSNALADLVGELNARPGTFEGCVHSSCQVQTIGETLEMVEWGRQSLGGRIYAAFGIHPTNFEEYTPEVEAQIEAALEKCGANGVAWGECGLDYFHRARSERVASVRQEMCDVFERQARAAVRLKLPLVVHSRDAEEDTIRVLRKCVPTEHPVYLHAYSGSHDAEMLTTFLTEWPNSYVGIAGAVTYAAAVNLHALARALPLDRILLESDGPYMAPEPYCFDHTHPGHIPWTASGVARAKDVPILDVLAASTANFKRFYKLG